MDHRTVETYLARAQNAIEQQAWRETRSYLERINPDHLGAAHDDYVLMAAACQRHMGDLKSAEILYRDLTRTLTLQDTRLHDALLGISECAHLRGEFHRGLKLAYAVQQMPMRSERLALRVAATAAHLWSHVDIEESVRQYRAISEDSENSHPTVRAHVLFGYADALLVSGRYEQALEATLATYEAAADSGATVTTADALRRLPLLRVLLDQQEFALRAVGDLAHAAELYQLAGDRGDGYVHTEKGEVYRALGRLREAHECFERGVWAARRMCDRNREAHNLLGLFEISRQLGTPDWPSWQAATGIYRTLKSDWGTVHASISRALAHPAEADTYLDLALGLIDAATKRSLTPQEPPFMREMELIGRLKRMSPAERNREPHLLNYP